MGGGGGGGGGGWGGGVDPQNAGVLVVLVPHRCNIFVGNWSNTISLYSALWLLMAWCFSTRTAVATMLIKHPCVSSHLWVNRTETDDNR